MTVGDAQAMFEWAGDAVTTQFMAWPMHASPEDSANVLKGMEGLLQSRPPNLHRAYGLERTEYRELIGSISLRQDGPATVSSAWIIAERQRRKGFASEACLGLFATAFAELPWLEAIHFSTHPMNHAALAMAVRLGFRAWGTVHKDFPQMHLRHFEVPLYRLLRP